MSVGVSSSLRPGERAEDLLALFEDVPSADPVALDADGHVGLQPHGQLRAARVGAMPLLRDRPRGRDAAVVEDRFAGQLDLDLALQADRHAHEQMLGVFVGRGTGVGRDEIHPAAGPERERVAHGHPAGRRVPGRQQRVRARLIHARGGHVDAERGETEGARLAIEQRAEHAGRVEAGHAQPVDRAVGGDQRTGVAVGEEGVVGDRRKRRGRRGALGHRGLGVAVRRRGLARARGLLLTHRARSDRACSARLTASPTDRARRRSRRGGACPPPGPTSRARRGGPAEGSRATAGRCARSPRRRPAG